MKLMEVIELEQGELRVEVIFFISYIYGILLLGFEMSSTSFHFA
jgi:hypothetical protein